MITATMLRTLGACEGHVQRFEAEWPDGAEVTPATLERAHALGLDVPWLARNPSTPAPILERLSADRDAGVRGNVAYNPSTPARGIR